MDPTPSRKAPASRSRLPCPMREAASKAVVGEPGRHELALPLGDADPATMPKGVRDVDTGVVRIIKHQREDRHS